MLLMVPQMAMKRILILGCCGSGKTSFARQLHAATQIPLIHLDREYWLPNWTEPPQEEWNRIVADLVQRETWINLIGQINSDLLFASLQKSVY